MRNLKVLAVLGGVALVLGATSVVYAMSASDAEPVAGGYVGASPAPGDLPESAPTGAERSASVAEALPILSRPRVAADRIPDEVANSPILADGPAELGESRRLRREGADRAWIAPSSNREAVCLIAPGELNCPSARDVEERGAAVATFWHATGPIRVTGVATSAVRSVEVVDADRRSVEVPVVDGSFLYESERAAREVRWNGPDGVETRTLPRILGRE